MGYLSSFFSYTLMGFCGKDMLGSCPKITEGMAVLVFLFFELFDLQRAYHILPICATTWQPICSVSVHSSVQRAFPRNSFSPVWLT
jgi:hypothetical protein